MSSCVPVARAKSLGDGEFGLSAEHDVLSLSSVPRSPGTGHDPRVLGAIEAWCREHDTFAGMTVSGATLYVGFTRDAGHHLTELRRAFPEVHAKAFVARHTYTELRAALDLISRELPSLRKAGVVVASVGMDASRNAIVVRLPIASASAREWLAQRFGPELVVFEEGEPFSVTQGGRGRPESRP